MFTKQVKIGGTQLTIELRDDIDQSVANEIFSFHEYRAAEPLIQAATDPVADIGAHAGFFTLLARGLNPSVPIIVIEPAKENLHQLKRNLAFNKVAGVTILDGAAVGEKRGQKLIITKDSHNHYLSDAPQKRDEARAVPLFTLADIRSKLGVDRLSVVKCDIEGGEYDIILQTPDEELQKAGAFILEYHAERKQKERALAERLRELGFGVQTFPSKFDKTMGFLFAVNKRKK